jgi:hypothetical protein
MEVIITEWGLQSYIDLLRSSVFTDIDYKTILRPDVVLLKTNDPFDKTNPIFANDKFWGPATHHGQVINGTFFYRGKL